MITKLQFTLSEMKKHSGKYILDGTENDQWPTTMYFKKEWFDTPSLPQKVTITIEASK